MLLKTCFQPFIVLNYTVIMLILYNVKYIKKKQKKKKKHFLNIL